MGLDFGWTCPDIDKSIEHFKQVITDNIELIMDECCPMIEGKQKEEFVKRWSDDIYNESEAIFEDVRVTNSDLRTSAEKQLEDIDEDKKNLEDEILELNNKIDELENTISELDI